MKQNKPMVPGTISFNFSRKDLSQRRKGAKNQEFSNNNSAAPRLCEMKVGIKLMRIVPGILLLPLLLLLGSCFGVNADIALNSNGSGTIALEYQINKSLKSLGELDGNERWNTIPVGMADFQRTMDRLPEMKLLSFSSKEDGKNIVISAKMEFSSIQGLSAFLDASGRQSSFKGDAKSGDMVLTLNKGAASDNTGFDEFLAGICEGYFVRVSFSFPGEGSLSIADLQGKPLPKIPGSEINPRGKKVSFTIPIYQVLSSSDGINAEFRW